MKIDRIFFIAIAGLISLSAGYFVATIIANYQSENAPAALPPENVSGQSNSVTAVMIAIDKQKSSAQNNILQGDSDAEPEQAMPVYNQHITSSPAAAEIAERPLAAIISELPGQFLAEPLNEPWAFEQQQKLQKAFAENVEFQARELKSINCKSSICEIQFYAEDQQQLWDIAADINHLLVKKYSQNFSPNIMSRYSAGEKVASYYFSNARE